MKRIYVIGFLFLPFMLAACGGTGGTGVTGGKSAGYAPPPKAVKVGKPYVIAGKTYYPEYDPHYDETGLASWYGPGFHGNQTANGERFNTHDMTAAHPTLPMPSLVRVTNLQTGRSAVIRVNDRGPFKRGRIIDLSKAAAEELDVIGPGIAKVRVQYLRDETETYWANMDIKANEIRFSSADPDAPSPATLAQLTAEELASERAAEPAPITSVIQTTLEPAPMPASRVAEAQVVDNSLTIRSAPENAPFSLVNSAHAEEISAEETPDEAPYLVADAGKGNASLQPLKPKAVNLYHDAPPAVEAQQATAPNGGGYWYVQAGAFSSAGNATRLADNLEAIGTTVVDDIQSGGRTLKRVRVGPFTTKADANKALAKTSQYGVTGGRVVKE